MTTKEEKNKNEIKLEKEVARLQEENENLLYSNKTLKDINILVAEMNDWLRLDLACYEKGIKPSCSDFVNTIQISKGTKPRPDFLLQKNWFLPLFN